MTISSDDIQLAYIAFFSRPGDHIGLTNWLSYSRSRGSLSAVINTFASTEEYNQLYAGLSTSQRINRIYQYLFNRSAEPLGLQQWTQEVENGRIGIGDIAYAVARGALGSDADTLNAKLRASNDFTLRKSTTNSQALYSGYPEAAGARSWLSSIDSSYSTLTSDSLLYIDSIGTGNSWLVDERLSAIYRTIRTSILPSSYNISYYINSVGDTRSNFSDLSSLRSVQPLVIPNELQSIITDKLEYISNILPNISFTRVSSVEQSSLEFHYSAPSSIGQNIAGLATTRLANNFLISPSSIINRIDIAQTSNLSFFQYVLLHELGHVLGLEHPFESADGDQLLGLKTSNSLMAYSLSNNALMGNYETSYTPIDIESLTRVWRL